MVADFPLEEITMQKSKSYQLRARLRLARSPEFYRNFVAGFRKSGMTVGEYCRKYQVGANSFRKYRKESEGTRIPRKAVLVKSLKLVRLVPDAAPPSTASAVEILLPGGAVIRLLELNAKTLDLLRPILFSGEAPC